MEDALQNSIRSFLDDPQRRQAALLSSGYQGSAYLYEDGLTRMVVKQASDGPFGWLHRRMLRREARVYELLANVDGVPHSAGLLDGRWLLLDYVDGQSLKEARKQLRHADRFYSELQTVISSFHAAGVAHGDLKRKDNVLVDSTEKPHVIDFGTATLREGGLLDRLLYPLVVRIDRNSWIKAKYRFELDSIVAEDRDWYQPTLAENAFRQMRRFWRTITFRQTRNRWRKAKAEKKN